MLTIKFSSLLLSSMLTLGFVSCDNFIQGETSDQVTSLTADEKSNLRFLREEEKLARDVYLYLYEKYELKVFKNIASSEQKHIEAILIILNKYNIDDPAATEKGVFNDNALQQLYDDLIAQGNTSLIGALTVGATIEDVDIRDLDNAISATSKTELIDMYNKLACGSRNHMRAFTRQLNDQGETYSPQFISSERYREIINGEQEKCGRKR